MRRLQRSIGFEKTSKLSNLRKLGFTFTPRDNDESAGKFLLSSYRARQHRGERLIKGGSSAKQISQFNLQVY